MTTAKDVGSIILLVLLSPLAFIALLLGSVKLAGDPLTRTRARTAQALRPGNKICGHPLVKSPPWTTPRLRSPYGAGQVDRGSAGDHLVLPMIMERVERSCVGFALQFKKSPPSESVELVSILVPEGLPLSP